MKDHQAPKKEQPVRINKTAHLQLYALKALPEFSDGTIANIANIAIQRLFVDKKKEITENIAALCYAHKNNAIQQEV